MSSTYILFEIPKWIAEGLQNGTLTRGITGVIREVANGQIVYHLKEVAQMVDPEEIMKNLQTVGKQLVGIQQMQAMQVAGIAGVGLICIAGFVYLGVQLRGIKNQLRDIKNQLEEVQNSLNKINEKLDRLHAENIIKISEPYFQAMAAYQEEDYAEGLRLARKCSGAIHNYFVNVPIKEILSNNAELTFLMRTLNSAMRCQLACAAKYCPEETHKILKRYHELFAFLNDLVDNTCKKAMIELPDKHTHVIMCNLKNKNGILYNLRDALPAAVEMLESEQRFIELTKGIEPAQLEAAIASGAKYIGVALATN